MERTVIGERVCVGRVCGEGEGRRVGRCAGRERGDAAGVSCVVMALRVSHIEYLKGLLQVRRISNTEPT